MNTIDIKPRPCGIYNLEEVLWLKCIISWERQGEQSLGLFRMRKNHLEHLCNSPSTLLQHLILWISRKEIRTPTKYSKLPDAGDTDHTVRNTALKFPMAQFTNYMPR